ncbi:Fumarate hydratase class II [Propionispora sp. 2/2-37]|uniref:class II fumarate hydratase n=1 Tax=Propionispora sp. 2/2-37 TaxID=1677858 RepID=UPI0006BB8847|nr:class II fumarate hydratase [Propionispora sp. 2/2-37]CUH95533.1 Fumarate hydratase class II [Propionispora sp. 2/2-37]
MEYRIEKDSLGEVKVPADKLWGAQTQRSYENFRIGSEKIPAEMVTVFGLLKRAAATVNKALGVLDETRADAIIAACDELLDDKLEGNFPLSVWQTGSGTQFNMNVNEVLAHRAQAILKAQGRDIAVHPNDHVNRSQSSNDIFPTSLHVVGLTLIRKQLFPALENLLQTLQAKLAEFNDIVKIGRTHLMDATPLTLGQEISGWAGMLERNKMMLTTGMDFLRNLAMGGTAVGTGINSHPDFGVRVADEISRLTGEEFKTAPNKFHSLTSKDELVVVHGMLRALAADLMKIANDVRWLASGPRCGIGELTIPANEPGSSIMPSKVNPTQAEALTMIVTQVFGNDTTIGFAASQGNFQLNVFMPVIAYNFIQTVRLLSDGMNSFNEKCAVGLEPNRKKIEHNLNQSLILITGLVPLIGYDKAAEIAKKAAKEAITLKEAALSTGYVTEADYKYYMDPARLIKATD